MIQCGVRTYHAFLKRVNEIEHCIFALPEHSFAIPINEDQVHHEVMWEKDIHQKQSGDVKDDTSPQNPPTTSTPKDRERKK